MFKRSSSSLNMLRLLKLVTFATKANEKARSQRYMSEGVSGRDSLKKALSLRIQEVPKV
ncbi:hypothetical protein KC19_2G079800 [Ceratodon purpureus]|uniref:Uncharacterized protein n=1 Tax=Ceratodon purpureus TaxID=3225 RepID=A0A8T0IT87_CERPU|nr:hypothetical protein KC19_2G079800 [Ceratodon purpureus]